MTNTHITIIGAGPAGLAAAEALSLSGHAITVYDAMPTPGRKFLLAGKSGLNLTHAEDFAAFTGRFGAASAALQPALKGLTPKNIRDWAAGLGIETYTGSSGRVFPTAMKASPLLRAWRKRLEERGVRILTRHRWTGFSGRDLLFSTPDGDIQVTSDAVVLALGGASWPRLGSDARWVAPLAEKGVAIRDFRPANCGFDLDWSDVFKERFAGAAVKSVSATSNAGTVQGEFVVTDSGIEGSLVYAHAAALRDRIEADGSALLTLDLVPGRTAARLAADLAKQDAKASLSNRLRKGAGLDGVKAALIREIAPDANRASADDLAVLIKALPLPVLRPRPIAEAISSAGGVSWDAIDEHYMLKRLPGMFVAGEMIDWEAPTGGYLLTACLATGRAAAAGVEAWLAHKTRI